MEAHSCSSQLHGLGLTRASKDSSWTAMSTTSPGIASLAVTRADSSSLITISPLSHDGSCKKAHAMRPFGSWMARTAVALSGRSNVRTVSPVRTFQMVGTPSASKAKTQWSPTAKALWLMLMLRILGFLQPL